MIKIARGDLVDYLSKASVKSEINECILDFREDGVHFVERNPENNIFSFSKLGLKKFKEYESIGKVCVGNSERLIVILSRFVGDIEIKKEDNKLKIKGLDVNRNSSFVLSDEESITKQKPKLEKFQHDLTFKIPASKLKDAVSNCVSLKGDNEMLFETTKGVLSINSEEQDSFSEIYKNDKIDKDIKVKFGTPLISVIQVLSGEVEIRLKNDYPMMIVSNIDDSTYSYIIAHKELE